MKTRGLPGTVGRASRPTPRRAGIKAAAVAFDRSQTNALDALNAIVVAVEAYRAAAEVRRVAA